MTLKPYYSEEGITIYHGDCLEILPHLGRVDHVITDPPYFAVMHNRLKNVTDLSLLGKQDATTRSLRDGIIGTADNVFKPVSTWIGDHTNRWALIFSDVESAHRWRFQLVKSGMRFMRSGAWVKPAPMPQFSGDRPSTGFELCTIVHNKAKARWNGGGKAAVWIHDPYRGDDRGGHPTPKPLTLMRELVALFTDPGELIIDPFMGSGMTLLAAKQLGRRAIGIELEEKWCDLAVKRLKYGNVKNIDGIGIHAKACRYPALACICHLLEKRK